MASWILNSPKEREPTERQKRVTVGWLTPARARELGDGQARRGLEILAHRLGDAALGRAQIRSRRAGCARRCRSPTRDRRSRSFRDSAILAFAGVRRAAIRWQPLKVNYTVSAADKIDASGGAMDRRRFVETRPDHGISQA